MKIINEFKEFAVKGNVIDMAIGIIIGGAFGKIVTSLVNDVVTPFLGLFMGGMNFTEMVWTLKAATETKPALVLYYGKFVQTVIDFLIVAWVVFLVVKAINKVRRAQEELAVRLKNAVDNKVGFIKGGKDESK